MFKATDFMYDGIYSAKYGLKIASFDNESLDNTEYVTPQIAVSKPGKSKKFYYLDTTYESPPKYEFSIVGESAIPQEILREVLNWLDARVGFKPLIIMQPGVDDLTYSCIFTVTNLIYHAGSCVGLRLTATFDSNYILGKSTKVQITGTGAQQEVMLYNKSDNIDFYVYPKVTFKTTDGNVSVKNLTDDPSREFIFKDLNRNVEYTVDNELKIIMGEGQNLLGKFNKNWLRVLRGKNRLSVKINGTMTITCPRQLKISF